MLTRIWNSTKVIACVLEKLELLELLVDNIIVLSLRKLDCMLKEKQMKKEMQSPEIKLSFYART